MYVLRILGLFTLLLSLSSFSEAVKNTEKSVVVNTATTKAVENKSKPKKKTFSPPKKGKKATTRVASTAKKRHKLPPKRSVAHHSAKKSVKKASVKRAIAIAITDKKKKPVKADIAIAKSKRYAPKKHTGNKALKQYAENTLADTELEDDLEDEELFEEPESYETTDIALTALSKSKADTKQQKVLLDTAFSYLGTPYRHGGVTRNGMDCSGFVSTTFKSISVPLSRSSQEMATQGTKIDLEDVKVGDLLFFRTTRKSRISHVGMVVDIDGDIKFIHSSSKRGVVISSLSDEYYKKTFRMAKRVM
ncbi:C40 family peptidase [Capnocytophaga sp. oral taxon 324]|uniref:C40 family peptidase n=1 Tax=Capnocytophaga sp. oral taxon 324 TaxID=712211 RepID=UPI0002A39285|nr:C40 family peptidase [Capnocytophaga sp. oral taxon 324]EKY17253.1 NlpC/P60 family protein [Capnocytophaga sp. oral taxon 324 str. F0483]